MTQHDSINSQLESDFSDWLDGKELSAEKMAALQQHPVWSERMLTFANTQLIAEQAEMEPIDMPSWDRNAGFNQYLRQQSWWQRQGTSMLALTFSVFACVVMLFDLKVVSNEQGFSIARGGDQQQFAEQLARFAEQNDRQIQQRLDDFQIAQQKSTSEVVDYLMTNSRIERNEDIQDMVALIQQQRDDDLDYLKQQFSDMNYQIRRTRQDQRFNNEFPRETRISE